MKLLQFLFIYSISILSLSGQNQDKIWLFGSLIGDGFDDTWLLDTTYGASNMDFNFDPVNISYDINRVWDFAGTNASICDENGNLLLYTNGQAVYNGNHQVVEDTINYNAQWDNWTYRNDSIYVNLGLPTIQGAIILPHPNNSNLFYIFYSQYDLDSLRTTKMLYGLVDINADIGQGQMVFRDVPLIEELLSSGSLNAVKHANGRDWWIIFSARSNTKFFKFLLSPSGIENHGAQIIGDEFDSANSQFYFSPSGEFAALCSLDEFDEEGGQVVIMEFDRCTGGFFNRVSEIIPGNTFSQGVSFSPNNRFLYATDSDLVFQYDLKSSDILASRNVVAEYDGFEYYYSEDTINGTGLPTRFGWMGLAPNGKIYVCSTSGGSRVMHVVNSPNQYGEQCDVLQHSVYLPTSFWRTMPNFPNFRLGPADGSLCDTLGLNNNPISKFTFNKSKEDPLKIEFVNLSYYEPENYEWDFGDDNSSNEFEPVHSYSEKGIYEVCLTASNIYSSNKSCKTIYLNSTSAENDIIDAHKINLYPNPVRDKFSLSLENLGLKSGSLLIYTNMGEVLLRSEINEGLNQYDISSLSDGLYFYSILNDNDQIHTGKFIKIK